MSMISRSSAFFLVLVALVGFALFQVKYEVQSMEGKISRTLHLMAEEKESLHILKAEWTYLNEPKRLQSLAEKYLDVVPMEGQQVATVLTAFESSPRADFHHDEIDAETRAILASMRVSE